MELPTRYPDPFPKIFLRGVLLFRITRANRVRPRMLSPIKAIVLKRFQRLIMLHMVIKLLVEIWNEVCIFCKHFALQNHSSIEHRTSGTTSFCAAIMPACMLMNSLKSLYSSYAASGFCSAIIVEKKLVPICAALAATDTTELS